MHFTELVTFEVRWKMVIIALCLFVYLFSFLSFWSFCLYYCSSLPFLCIVVAFLVLDCRNGVFSLFCNHLIFFIPINIEDFTPFLKCFVLLIVLHYPIFVGLFRLLRLVTIFFIIATYFGVLIILLFFSFFSLLHPGYNLLWFVLFCQAASSKNWQLFFGYWLRRRYFLNFALQTFVDKPRIWLSGCLSFFLRAFLPL